MAPPNAPPKASIDAPATRQQVMRRRSALESDRTSWEAHWRDLSDFILPRKGRFLPGTANRGGAVNSRILNNTGTMALRTLASGLMSGLTSPARPWFKLVTRRPQMMEADGVKVWLEEVEELIREVFNRSNLYQCLHSTYEELGCFGTGALLVFEDFHTVVTGEALTAGQYWLATNARGSVDTLYRRYALTVGQIVDEFAPGHGDGRDWSKVSPQVRSLWDLQDRDTKLAVLQAIEPNPDYRPGPGPSWRKKVRSVWVEEGGPADRLLRVSGFDSFPAMCPRWHPTPGDTYGRSCGMDALEDIRQLQAMEREKARAIEKMVNPPLLAPAGSLVNDLPGGVNFYDSSALASPPVYAPLYQVNPRVGEMVQDQEFVRGRIRDAFYADLWLMIADIDRSGVTATEIDARREEKMLMLGPVLEQLHHELLDPLIDRVFDICDRAGLLPEVPEALAGQRVQVQYSSMLAQAQRAIATGSIERMVSFVGNLSAVMPTALDTVDLDEAARDYGAAIGAPARMLRSTDQIQALRDDRAKREAESQAMQVGSLAAQNAEVLSKTDTTSKNALTDMITMMQGG